MKVVGEPTGASDNVEVSEVQIEEDWGKSAYSPLTVAAAALPWTDFSASGTMEIRTSSGSLKSSFQLKMVNGKSVSFSLRPILGIEMGKIYIDTDSVTVVDKYHGIYLRESVARFLGTGMELRSLQSLLLSRPFDLASGPLSSLNVDRFEASAADDEGKWTLFSRDTVPQFSYFFDMERNNVKTFNVELPEGQVYALQFSEFKMADGSEIATCVDADIPIGGMAVKFGMKLTKSIRWNSGFIDSVSVPRDARRYSFAQIMKALTNQQ